MKIRPLAGYIVLFTLLIISQKISGTCARAQAIILNQPQSQFAAIGSTIYFNFSIAGDIASTPNYKWQKNGVYISDSKNILGSATTNLSISFVSTNDAGSYDVAYQYSYKTNNSYKFVSATSSIAKLTLKLVMPPQYTAVDIGMLGSGGSRAYGLNNKGQVVGASNTTTNGADHAFIYDNGAISDLGTLGGPYSVAQQINDSGQIVGYSTNNDGNLHAFIYSNGVMSDLGTLGGAISYANSINNLGQVTGISGDTNNNPHVFIYGNGIMSDLGATSQAYLGSVSAINDNGQIVGDDGNYPFLYQNGSINDIYLNLPNGISTSANDINNNGLIVGSSGFEASYVAYIYNTATGSINTNFGTLGGSQTVATKINDNGDVVGYNGTGGKIVYQAFLHTQGMTFNLNNLIDTNLIGTILQAPNGINNSDQIIANGANGHAYLLTPSATMTNSFLPQLQITGNSPANISFSWSTSYTYPPVNYQVQFSTNLAPGSWQNLGGAQSATTFTNPLVNGTQCFYRILLVQ